MNPIPLALVNRPRCDQTTAWGQLEQHFRQTGATFDLREAYPRDAGRFDHFSQSAPHVFADLSKNRIDGQTEQLLLQLARECRVEAHRDAMFAGEPINTTEGRAVLHTLLRAPREVPGGTANDPLVSERAEVHATLDAMLAFAETLRADDTITDVVNIGIGGSDLGPQMAVLALDAFVTPGKRFHFVSNVDGHELAAKLKHLNPRNTVFLIASKTFTTIETMTNALSARRWFEAGIAASTGTPPDIARHFIGLTTNVAAANAFGITTTFGFWDWVGGRYSVWSAIGLPLAMAIGADGFRAFLAGGYAMDAHFRTAPLESNLPVRLGQGVGHQARMLAGQVAPALAQRDELHGHDVAPLVDHLEERMLAVGAGLAPDHGRGGKRQRLAMRVHALAVALHLQLLQVGRQAAQAMAVGRHAAAGEAVEVAVPQVQQRQAHG